MGHENPTEDNAILKLMVEFRQLWIEQEAARSNPPASGPSAPPPPAPARRTDLRAFVLVVIAAMASAYLLGELLARSSALSVHLPWVPRADTATRPTASAPVTSAVPVAVRQTSAPEPAPPMVQPEKTPPAASVAPSSPPTSAHNTAPLAGYHVQVGAFNVREYAQDLMRQLRSHDYPANVVDLPTGPPHRVWITGVFDRPAAERLVARLRNDGFEAILLRQ
jgi:cell division septation protein DedD